MNSKSNADPMLSAVHNAIQTGGMSHLAPEESSRIGRTEGWDLMSSYIESPRGVCNVHRPLFFNCVGVETAT